MLIGVFDQAVELPTGGYLEQADGTAWMAFFSRIKLEIATQIAVHDNSYSGLAAKFLDPFPFDRPGHQPGRSRRHAKALERRSEDIKVVIQFADI